jgi:hypothetical protein
MIIKLSRIDGTASGTCKCPKLDGPENAVQPEHIEPEKAIVATWSNDATNANEFWWWVCGEKKPTQSKEGVMTHHRKYYRCSEKKTKGCLAIKNVVTGPSGVKIDFKHAHNHPPLPPDKQRVSFEVKETVMSQLVVGTKPSVIQQHLVNNASGPISRRDVPTMSQMYNWKHQMVMATLPTGVNASDVIALDLMIGLQEMPLQTCISRTAHTLCVTYTWTLGYRWDL